MHLCPRCQVPLHGHEQFCPACGTKQYVRSESRAFFQKSDKAFNPLPLALGVVAIGCILVVAVQNSWIGQVISRGPVAVDPNSLITPQAARQMLEEKLVTSLAATGAKGKFTWTSDGKGVDRNCSQSVELTIDTELSDPQQRRSIIDPVKQLMDPGKISTMTMNDSHSHATWTYSLTPVPEDKPDTSN